jgi:hypothetical protein
MKGCTKLRNEIETQRNILKCETKYTKLRNETQRNGVILPVRSIDLVDEYDMQNKSIICKSQEEFYYDHIKKYNRRLQAISACTLV